MKLADRSFMNETRYSQSFGDFTHRKNKMLSTGFTNNSLNTTMRLPKLTRSLSSSSTKSAKIRIEKVQDDLETLRTKLSQLRTDTRESRRYVNFLKEDLIQRQLHGQHNQLNISIKRLQNMFKMSRKQHEDRTATTRKDCIQLCSESKRLIDMVEQLSMRVDGLEEAMGIYSGKQKHKF